MKAIASFLTLLALLAGLVLFYLSAYTVDETEQVIITQFGNPTGRPINTDPPGATEEERKAAKATSEAGLHFKKPFVQQVNRFEKRVLEWNGNPTEMSTRDKLYISVESFARWRIADPLKYLQSMRDERSALSRLEDIIGSETRNVVARNDLIEVIRTDKDRKPEVDATLAQAGLAATQLPTIRAGRTVLEKEILKAAAPKTKDWGIELLDVRLNRINYKPGVIEKIYDRMISERLQIAERFRSEGAGEAAKIIGRKEKDLRQIESDAYRKVQTIQGAADAEATQIYSNVYNTSPAAADFYQFMKTMDTYKTILSQDSTLILTTDSDLFKYLKRFDAGASTSLAPKVSVPMQPASAARPTPSPLPAVVPAAPVPVPPQPAPADKPQ